MCLTKLRNVSDYLGSRTAPHEVHPIIGQTNTDILCHIEICVMHVLFRGWWHLTMGELVTKTGIKAREG